jgi:hypothetical protein
MKQKNPISTCIFVCNTASVEFSVSDPTLKLVRCWYCVHTCDRTAHGETLKVFVEYLGDQGYCLINTHYICM